LLKKNRDIYIVTSDAGFCHRSTEFALISILKKYHNLNVISFEVCKDIYPKYNPVKPIFKLSPPEIYNKIILKKSKTYLFWRLMLVSSKVYIKFHHRTFIKIFNGILEKNKPILVISLVPLFNNIFLISTKKYKIPFITIMIDLNEFQKSMWFQNEQQLVAVGTEKALLQALKYGIHANNIVQMTGNLISSNFINFSNTQCQNTRVNSKFKLLIVFGGQGLSRLYKYAVSIENSNLDVELFYICGKNSELYNKIKQIKSKKTKYIYEFSSNVSRIINKVDIVITKPGPCIIFESIEMKKPLLVELNRHTLIQERFNAKWVKENGFGLFFNNSKTLLESLNEVISGNKYAGFKEVLNKYKNNSSKMIENKIHQLICTK